MVRICEVMREAAVSRKNKLINTCHSITIAPTPQSLEGCSVFMLPFFTGRLSWEGQILCRY